MCYFLRLTTRQFRRDALRLDDYHGEFETLMRITIELEQADLQRFLAVFEKRLLREVDECDVLDATKQALNTLPIGSAPAYVRKQIGAVMTGRPFTVTVSVLFTVELGFCSASFTVAAISSVKLPALAVVTVRCDRFQEAISIEPFALPEV